MEQALEYSLPQTQAITGASVYKLRLYFALIPNHFRDVCSPLTPSYGLPRMSDLPDFSGAIPVSGAGAQVNSAVPVSRSESSQCENMLNIYQGEPEAKVEGNWTP